MDWRITSRTKRLSGTSQTKALDSNRDSLLPQELPALPAPDEHCGSTPLSVYANVCVVPDVVIGPTEPETASILLSTVIAIFWPMLQCEPTEHM